MGFAAGVGCLSSSCGIGSTLTFRLGALSLLPDGRPLFGVGVGSVCSLVELFGVVSEFSGPFFDFSTFLAKLCG